MRRRRAAAGALLAAVAVGIAAVIRGRNGYAATSTGDFHPYAHVLIFGVIAFLAAWSTRSAWVRVLLCVAVALLGYLTEVTEWYFDHLAMEWTDVVLDAIGTVAGASAAALLLLLSRDRM